MNKLWIIAKSTYKKNIKSWGYWGMIVMPFIMLAVIGAISYFSGNKADEMSSGDIAIVESEIPVGDIFEESSITVREDIKTQEEAEQALADDDIQGIVSIKVSEEGLLDVQVTEYGAFDQIRQEFEGILSQYQSTVYASHLKLAPEQLTQLFSPVQVDYQAFEDEQSDSQGNGIDFVQMGFAYLICFLSLMLVMFYAQTIINEIAADKGTRIMEVILSSTSASSHFLGKILGILGLLVTQLFIYIIPTVGLLYYFRDHEYVQLAKGFLSESDGLASTVFYSLLFFVLAVGLYISLSAFVGSLVNKTEDAAKMLSPISILVVIGFYGGIFGMMDGENIFIQVMSHIPFFTPFIMPFRMAAGTVSLGEVWISIGINVIFLILVTILATRLYKSNVLIYSDANPLKILRQSWKMSHE